MNSSATVARDLSKFTDPATETQVTEGTHGTRIKFTRNGSEHDYFLDHSDGSIVARHLKGRKYASLRSLLASSDFADIRGLATTQGRIYRDFALESLIQPEGELDGKKLALQTLHRALIPQTKAGPEMAISIMLLDGPAGIGKTNLIQRLLVQRVRTQHDTSASPPILHVANRGRRLSALDEVLAQSLQILRAKFTFDQVPALIRHNLIQLAIDGFDELVDPEGYRDVWFALRDFFDETEFGGPIILAGRDTFFDEQNFSNQMRESKRQFVLNHARLSAVSVSSAKDWLSRQGWKEQDLNGPYADLVLRPGSYALRPYFLYELAQAKGWSQIEALDLTPRAYLVDRFVARESELVSEKLSLSTSDVKARLIGIFEEIALEMADTETEAVDLSFLQMVTEFAFSDSLSEKDVAKLRHKSGSFALLVSDAREGFRRFPHTEISHHFLAHALVRLISAGTVGRFLRRGIISSDFLAVLSEILLSCPDGDAANFVNGLEKIISQESTFDRLPENAASLLLTSLSRNVESGCRHYHDLQVTNVVVLGQCGPARLERVRIQRLDAEEASLAMVEFVDCEIVNVFVDETTRFGATAPKIHQIHIKSPKGKIQDLFDPVEIEKWVAKHSVGRAAATQIVNQDAIWLLDKVCRVMIRQHMIKDHESDEAGRFLGLRYWPEIERVLAAAGRVTRLTGKPTSGASAEFVRLHDPYSLLAQPNAPQNVSIWKKVGAIQ